MCESIPPSCLPEPGSITRDDHPSGSGDATARESGPGETQGAFAFTRAQIGRSGLSRRSLLTALGGLALAGCMPAASPPCALAGSRGTSPLGGPPPRPRPRVRPRPAYEIVRRGTWGAAPLRDNHDPMARVTRITVHHTAEVPGMGERTDAELVKGIQNFHQDTRGWADIGYHWVIGRDGRVYEGRALTAQGAHAGGGNNIENLGISVMGDFTKVMPDAPMLATLTRFLRAQQRRYGVTTDQVFGHRDFKATECPGSMLYAWLERFKTAS